MFCLPGKRDGFTPRQEDWVRETPGTRPKKGDRGAQQILFLPEGSLLRECGQLSSAVCLSVCQQSGEAELISVVSSSTLVFCSSSNIYYSSSTVVEVGRKGGHLYQQLD